MSREYATPGSYVSDGGGRDFALPGGFLAGEAVTVPPGETTALLKVWTGSAWAAKPAKVWMSGAWTTKPAKYWDGVQWVGGAAPPSGPVRVSPINMTSATAPAPFVVTSKNYYDASFADWKAFDGNPATSCASNSRSPPPWWIKIDLGSPTCVSEYVYQPRSDYAGNVWRGWTLEGSHDDIHWLIVDTRVGGVFKSTTFVCPFPRTFRYWKWNVTDTPSDYADVGALELWGPVSGTPPMLLASPTNMTGLALPAPYVASSSNDLAGYEAWKAFDGDPASLAHSLNDIVTTPYWLKIDLGTPKNVTAYQYQARNVGPYHCWKSWVLEGSSDNVNWTTADTVVGEPVFAVSEIRAYGCATPGTFRYWRVRVLTTGGISGTSAETASFELWGTS